MNNVHFMGADYSYYTFDDVAVMEEWQHRLSDYDQNTIQHLDDEGDEKIITYLDCDDATIHGVLHIDTNGEIGSMVVSPSMRDYLIRLGLLDEPRSQQFRKTRKE